MIRGVKNRRREDMRCHMKKILIVEPELEMQEVLYSVLSKTYDAVCASSGREALERYTRERPDMILCELNMPEISGLELQRRLTEQYRELVPFMFMADDEQEDNESVGLQSGALDYIGKPFKVEVLMRRVDNTMLHIDNLRQIQGLKAVAETDPMTGLLNKTFAQKTLVDLCPKAKGVLMMLDLDSFKLVNDLYGHDMGDRVLIRFAEILRGVIRSSDVCGRMGGDEFIAFCRDVNSEQLVQQKVAAINAVFLASAKQLMGEDMNLPLGVSVGAIFVPDEGTKFDELYKKADKALYTAKQSGNHECGFSREHKREDTATVSEPQPDALGNARRILGERNRPSGAYEVGFESFRTVYRFINRMLENYHNDAEICVFNFPAGTSAEITDSFGVMLRKTLRRSDVYTKSGDNQFMVLLPQPLPEHGDVAINRVLDHWRADGAQTSPTFEHQPILVTE